MDIRTDKSRRPCGDGPLSAMRRKKARTKLFSLWPEILARLSRASRPAPRPSGKLAPKPYSRFPWSCHIASIRSCLSGVREPWIPFGCKPRRTDTIGDEIRAFHFMRSQFKTGHHQFKSNRSSDGRRKTGIRTTRKTRHECRADRKYISRVDNADTRPTSARVVCAQSYTGSGKSGKFGNREWVSIKSSIGRWSRRPRFRLSG